MFSRMNLERFNIDDSEEFPSYLDFQEVLSRDPNVQDENGHTILHAHVWNPDFDRKILQSLINKEANLELRNRNGKTAFLLAVVYRKKEMIEILIENGADANVQDNAGNNALHYIALPELNYYWKSIAENDHYFNSITDYDCKCLDFNDTFLILERLLKEGVNVNAMNQRDETPLMWAARGKYLDIVKMLLASGANVHLRNKNMETCLHLVATYIPFVRTNRTVWDSTRVAILLELARYKACVNCFDKAGCTALDYIRLSRRTNRCDFAWKLVKIAVLVNWRKRIDFDLRRGPFEAVHEQDLEMINYANKCYDEIHWMKKFELPGGSRLCQFARRGVSEDEKSKEFEINDAVLEILLRYRFPIYHDFFLSSFQTYYLRQKASDLLIYARGENRDIYLHFYVILELSLHLEKSDLFNLICVFSNAFPVSLPSVKRKIRDIN